MDKNTYYKEFNVREKWIDWDVCLKLVICWDGVRNDGNGMKMSDRWGEWRKGMDYRDRCENGKTIVIWNDTYGLFDGRR